MGSTLGIDKQLARQAGRVVVTTTMSACVGGITCVTFERLRGITRMWNVQEMCNGILAGLVSITASCATVMPWAAIIIGCIGGFVYRLASYWMLRRRIDDPLDAFAVHGACGCWGVVASAFFSTKNYAKAVGGFEEGGVFYGGGELLGAAAVFIAAPSTPIQM